MYATTGPPDNREKLWCTTERSSALVYATDPPSSSLAAVSGLSVALARRLTDTQTRSGAFVGLRRLSRESLPVRKYAYRRIGSCVTTQRPGEESRLPSAVFIFSDSPVYTPRVTPPVTPREGRVSGCARSDKLVAISRESSSECSLCVVVISQREPEQP